MMQFRFVQDAQGVHHATCLHEFRLQSGRTLQQLTLTYESYGPDEAKDIVLIHHSLSTSSHVCSTALYPKKGWWEAIVGHGKAIDTRRFRVICINNLGSCYGSTGPVSLDPETGVCYGADFPAITLDDIVKCQHDLLCALGIERCHTIIGGSMGGMLSLCWAHHYPDYCQYLIAISMSHKAYPLQMAHRACQRQAIYLDEHWCQGHYSVHPTAGLKLARMVSHLFYRGLDEIDARFSHSKATHAETADEDVVGYYHYNADKFAREYDANSYLRYLDAMDTFDLTRDAVNPFADLGAACLIISTDTDILYPRQQQFAVYQLMQAAGCDVKFIAHNSLYGHDAFLVDSEMMSHYISTHINPS